MATDTVIFLLQHLGFVISHRKSILTSLQKIEFLGLPVDSVNMPLSLTPGKLMKVTSQCLEMCRTERVSILQLTKLGKSDHSAIDKAHKSFKFNSTSSGTCTISVLVFTTNSGRIAQSRPFTSTSINLEFQSKTGTSLVSPKPKTMQWKMFCTTPSTNGDSNGCFQNRLGNIIPGSYYTGSMVKKGQVSSHKCVGTSGSEISSIEFYQEQGNKNYTLSDRQYNNTETFDKYGRSEVFENDQIKQRDIGLSSIT